MVKKYTVYCGERYIGVYHAPSAKKAVEKVIERIKNPKGTAKHLYRAEEVKDD